jgi:HTH-type transcriptional regulator/antitoxin HigA
MEPKIIKTDEQYRAYLAEVERLATDDPAPGTPDGDRLELFAKLVEDYEKDRFKFTRPDPVSAIRFRMEEKGLKQKDLASIMGGKNRVSEVLAGKRPLTLAMVRALSDELHIPTDLLIREGYDLPEEESEEEWDQTRIPIAQILRSGQFEDQEANRLTTGDIVRRYLKPTHGPLYLKRTITYGSSPTTNKLNLKLWVGRVRELANQSRRSRGSWRPETIDQEFLTYVARLSWSEKGPKLAQEFLREKGIALVILPAFPQTRLDGAAMQDEEGAPIIGLTLRHDRLDNFWFTLLHELVHAWKHLPERDMAITDEDLDKDHDADDTKEAEANRIARESFVPRSVWSRSEAFLRPSYTSITALANRLHISPAVVAGRLRHEKGNYAVFGKLVGYRQTRRLFPEVNWS